MPNAAGQPEPFIALRLGHPVDAALLHEALDLDHLLAALGREEANALRAKCSVGRGFFTGRG